MPMGNLTHGKTRLQEAVKDLEQAWFRTQDLWNDANSRQIQEQDLAGLTPKIRAALEASNRLDQMMRRMGQALADPGESVD